MSLVQSCEFDWLISHTFALESIRAEMCPSRMRPVNSFSSALTVVLNASAILARLADRYGLKY